MRSPVTSASSGVPGTRRGRRSAPSLFGSEAAEAAAHRSREPHHVSTWNLTERRAVDLRRVASALCRPSPGR
ncbi:putative leader peptide [Cellulomonas biazotea]|uniref:putative leader peptide n=1 Tax=Cellulomonas biazotea TaxID=1709 RepID=UPI0035A24022